MAHLLVVDDDLSLLELLDDYLERLGHVVDGVASGVAALERLEAQRFDLVILDVTMPGLDGWDLLSQIRTVSRVPVIMLTARADEPDILRGFAGGVDDYVTKPFSFAQLAARVGAVLERASPEGGATGSVIRASDLEVDLERHRVLRAGEPIELTPTEFRILVTLLRASDRVLSARQIVTAVWGPEYGDDTGYIRRYVWHLRQKLERDPRHPRYITNERSFGYRFVADPELG
jgi:two-component system KDP operon response regulator KdpE